MKGIVPSCIFSCFSFLLLGQSGTTTTDTLVQLPLNEVVVSGSRVSEKLLASPVSIAVLDIYQIRRAAAPSFF